jgi:spermidine synthase
LRWEAVPVRRFFLLATCFLMGFAILGLELLGFRLYGPAYGYSTYVSGTLIGVILAALSLGYVIGGRLADRSPRPAVLYRLLTIAGLLLVVFSFVYDDLLDWFYLQFEFLVGLVLVTVLIYGPPMVLLSVTSPFIIRLIALQDRVGTAAGSIYALSTIGSILGSFLTPFVLVPTIGSHMTLLIMTAIVLVVGVLGLVGVRGTWALALLALGLLPFSFPKAEEGVVLRVESPYSDLQVKRGEEEAPYVLAVNRWAWYSKGLSRSMTTSSYYDYFLLGPGLVPVKEMAVLGMAAGTTIKQFQHFYPRIHIDAIEIDPWVVKIAENKKYFGIEEGPNLTIHVQDARPYLRTCTKRYDLVEIDMYQGGPFIPFYVTTVEFFQLVSDRMADDGLAITNVLALSDDELLVACVIKTVQAVFPSVYVLQHRSNYLLFAFKKPTSLEEVRTRLEPLTTGPLGRAARRAGAITTPTPYPGAHVFTDDKADVARITFNMIRRYANERRLEQRREREARSRQPVE